MISCNLLRVIIYNKNYKEKVKQYTKNNNEGELILMKKFVLISDVLKDADYAYDLADPEIVIEDSEGYYGENTKNRVSIVPNRGKIPVYNLSKDEGPWTATGISNCPGPLPGPVFIPESARFNKKPACFF